MDCVKQLFSGAGSEVQGDELEVWGTGSRKGSGALKGKQVAAFCCSVAAGGGVGISRPDAQALERSTL